MKKAKIISAVVVMNLVLFLSVSSIANSFTGITGDDENRSDKNQTEFIKSSLVDLTSANDSENEFIHLSFNVNNFNIESDLEDLPFNTLNYLRFNLNNFSEGISSEITELPVMNQFDYLRFDSNDFGNSSEIYELPVNEFNYLRFDVSKFSTGNSGQIEEFPAR